MNGSTIGDVALKLSFKERNEKLDGVREVSRIKRQKICREIKVGVGNQNDIILLANSTQQIFPISADAKHSIDWRGDDIETDFNQLMYQLICMDDGLK